MSLLTEVEVGCSLKVIFKSVMTTSFLSILGNSSSILPTFVRKNKRQKALMSQCNPNYSDPKYTSLTQIQTRASLQSINEPVTVQMSLKHCMCVMKLNCFTFLKGKGKKKEEEKKQNTLSVRLCSESVTTVTVV